MAEGFFGGFAEGFNKSIDARRQREAMRQRADMEAQREERRQQQFQEQQNLRIQQFEALQAARQRQAEFQQKQLQLQQRSADLDLTKGMMQAFDPKVPKAARSFLLHSMAKHLGVDPKSDSMKELNKLVIGLEDESLSDLRATISSLIPNAQPGQVSAFAKSIFSGEVTLPQITQAMDGLRQQQNIGQVMSAGPAAPQAAQGGQLMTPAPLAQVPGLPEPAAEDRTSDIEVARKRADAFMRLGMDEQARTQLQLARDLEAGKEFDPRTRGRIKAEEKAGEQEAALEQPISPTVTRLLGIPGMKLTNRQAQDMGISVDLLDDKKEIRDLFKQKAAVTKSVQQMTELAEMVRGKPELIGLSGTVMRSVNSVLRQVAAIPELAEAVSVGNFKVFQDVADIADILQGTKAEKSALIQSRIMGLAFSLAKAHDDGRLSDQDIQRSMTELGRSQSDTQFTAVLEDLADRVREGVATDIEAIAGVRPLDLMSGSQLLEMSESMDDPAMLRSILKELDRRGRGR